MTCLHFEGRSKDIHLVGWTVFGDAILILPSFPSAYYGMLLIKCRKFLFF